MAEKLLVVNKKDRIIGAESREKCHQDRGILHRAFSILIFNKIGELLLTKRSRFKKLWPLFWDNSCSSHPLKGESYEVAGQKRLKKELGFACKLKLVDKFFYWARYKNIGSENEICALLIGKHNSQKIRPSSKEIADWRWINLNELRKNIRQNPKKYTPWLKIDLRKINYRVI